MRTQLLTTIALIVCVGASVSGTPAVKSVADHRITGDYVEARTASVFAGACHYNGELVTIGREAILAWNFTGGSINGVDLRGLRAVAAVTSNANLGDEQADRRTELAVDSSATDQQVAALKSLLQSSRGSQLGQIVAIRRTPVTFSHGDKGYVVEAAGFASMSVQYMPDDSCCAQPNLVWYSPLSLLEHRKVGFTESASFTGAIGDHWQRSGENSAFYGDFAL